MRRRLPLPVCIVAVVLFAVTGVAVGGLATPAASLPPVGRFVLDPAWTNLLRNAGAEAGDASAQGWDAVTIPGWQIRRGLPTVVRYGTGGFPAKSSRGPENRGRQLFAGGAGGTAVLAQRVPIRAAAGGPLREGARYSLSGWLGAPKAGYAGLEVRFESSSGSTLGTRAVPGVTTREEGGRKGLVHRSATGAVPAGTVSAEVDLVLGTTLKDYDGPDSPLVGYDRSVADDVSFDLSAPVVAPAPLSPPVARVPRFRHVFVVYMENEDYGDIVGNTAEAPFLNSLRRQGSVLSDMYAEEHPSDGNYLALAGGSTFGLPLTDPLEENPYYTIDGRNIGDLVDSAHESWRGYLQSANGPCDDTVHRYYWNDDLPMLYFKDVREQPAYCSDHLVPLTQLATDLKSAATTPTLAWIGPNDCADMEGCGIRAGDDFLAGTLRTVFDSPAWTSQPSLLIITFDEDATDFERPAQRIPTFIVGSRFVKQGYVSSARYTHYSLLRTIEAALRLGSLTDNDRYARAVNDVFTGGGRGSGGAASSEERTVPATTEERTVPATTKGRAATAEPAAVAEPRRPEAGAVGARLQRAGPVAYVLNSSSASVTPINLLGRRAGRPIQVGREPVAVAIAPGRSTAYVVNHRSNSVTPIDIATNHPGRSIKVGDAPSAIAITPNGATAYVVDTASDAVTPISTATDRPGRPIAVGAGPAAIAIAPDGRTAYVVDQAAGAVTPIATASDRPGRPIRVGSYPSAIAITPDGATAFVSNYGSDTVTPIDLATKQAAPAINVGGAPDGLAITADGTTVLVADGNSGAVTPISTASLRAGAEIPVGYAPTAIAVDPRAPLAFSVNTISGTITPIDTATLRAGRPISVGIYSYPTAVAFSAGGSSALVVGTYSGIAVEVSPASRRVTAWLDVGAFPVAVAVGEPPG